MMQRVPLVKWGGSSDRNTIMGIPTLRQRVCGGNPDTSIEFRNSTGKCSDSSSDTAVSTDLKLTDSPANALTICWLMLRTVLFNGARMAYSPNHLVFIALMLIFGYTVWMRLSSE